MGKTGLVTPASVSSVQGTENDVKVKAGMADAGRAIKRDKVTDYPERLAYRTAQCKSGDSYSCGVKSALKAEFTIREAAIHDASRLIPGDRALRGEDRIQTPPTYNRGTVVADSKGQCGDRLVAFRPDSFVVEGGYECVLPNHLLSGDQLERSIAAINRLIPKKD